MQPAVKFKCFRCERSNFLSLTHLKEHQVVCCDVNSSSYGGPVNKQPQQQQHLNGETSSNSNSNHCSSVDNNKTISTGGDISTKIRITRKVFLCSSCGTYYENWNLFLHMREVHKRHICLFCLGLFPSAERLVYHLENKHNVKENFYETKENLMDTYKDPCYLMCCTCEHVFTEHDDFTNHLCENYIQPCILCGIESGHSINCKGAVNSINNSLVVKNHERKKSKKSSKRRELIDEKILLQKNKLIKQNGDDNSLMIFNQKDLIVADENNKKIVDDESQIDVPTINTSQELINNHSVNQMNDEKENVPIDVPEIVEKQSTENILIDKPLLVPKLKVRIPKEFCTPIESEETSSSDDEEEIIEEEEDEFEEDEEEVEEEVEQPEPPQKLEEIKIEEKDDSIIENKYIASEDLQEIKEIIKKEEEIPTDGIIVANEDTLTLDLSLEQPLDKICIKEFMRICLKSTFPYCLYCNHARRIAVNGKNFAIHLIQQHRFNATVDSITAEELLPNTIVLRLKSSLDELESVYFNLDTYDSCDKTFKPTEKIFECFQCRLQTKIHKELYLHNRKMHLKMVLLCIMCKSNFFSYSELLCHICPGAYNKVMILDLTFRCCLCNLDNIPSAFRLMVHLRKAHFACDVCLEECQDQSRLSNHVWKHKLHHLCYRCGIAYRNKADITKHLFWKHGTESVLCKKCLQKKWPHVYHFCIPPVNFICEVCNLTFKKAVALKVHKRLHSGDAPYPCTEDDCEKSFISRKLLLKHVARHSEPPPVIQPQIIEEIKPVLIELEILPDPIQVKMEKPIKEKKKKKIKEIKPDKPKIIDLMDLPVPNLSESDSSDESENEQIPVKPEIKEKLNIWNSFKAQEPLEKIVEQPLILHVSQSDHDYCSMYKKIIKTTTISTTVDFEEELEKLKPKKIIKNSSSSSDSSSGSDSSCSCGSNCSCSSSNSSSSSSSSSEDSDSSSSIGRRRIAAKKEKKLQRKRQKTENIKKSTSETIDVVATEPIEPIPIVCIDPDSIIFETDLETDESDTDEDYYDENPQKLATQLLAEKRKQLMAQTCMNPMNNAIVENSRPSTPSLPEEIVKEKKVKVKKKKKDRKSSKLIPPLKLNIPIKVLPTEIPKSPSVPPLTLHFNHKSIETIKIKTPPPIIRSSMIHSSKIRLSSESNSETDGSIKRSKRRRVPNRFYGYSSDEDGAPRTHHNKSSAPTTPSVNWRKDLLLLKPTPPPNLTWAKEDLPSPTHLNIRTPPPPPPPSQIKSTISSPALSYKSTDSYRSLKQTLSLPPIPSVIIRTPTIQHQPPRIEPLRVPAVPVHHINLPTTSQNSKESDVQSSNSSDTDDSSSEGTLQITQPIKTPKIKMMMPRPPPPILSTPPTSNFRNFPMATKPRPLRAPREGESVYCYCRCPYDEVSEMIACDGDSCVIEWFHFECVGIMVPPKGKWYCPDCKPRYLSQNYEYMAQENT